MHMIAFETSATGGGATASLEWVLDNASIDRSDRVDDAELRITGGVNPTERPEGVSARTHRVRISVFVEEQRVLISMCDTF